MQESCQINLLAAKLRALRANKSLYAIEKESGISRGNLLRYENGMQIPENDSLKRIAAFYQVSFIELKKLWVADLFPEGSIEREALFAWLKDEELIS